MLSQEMVGTLPPGCKHLFYNIMFELLKVHKHVLLKQTMQCNFQHTGSMQYINHMPMNNCKNVDFLYI